MGPRKTRETFPQLSDVLYSAVYCEAMHNDARTGTVRPPAPHSPPPSPTSLPNLLDLPPEPPSCTSLPPARLSLLHLPPQPPS